MKRKKLVLKKTTISTLSQMDQGKVKGGTGVLITVYPAQCVTFFCGVSEDCGDTVMDCLSGTVPCQSAGNYTCFTSPPNC
jgi:hypothetical protein